MKLFCGLNLLKILFNLRSNLSISPNVTAITVQGKKVALQLVHNKIDITILPKGVYTLQFDVDGQLVNKRLAVH